MERMAPFGEYIRLNASNMETGRFGVEMKRWWSYPERDMLSPSSGYTMKGFKVEKRLF